MVEVTAKGGGEGVGRIHMKREINFLSASAIMTGVIIGSGIFVSPVSIVAQCGSVGLSLVVWAVSGVLTLFIVLSYIELAGMFPQAGGDYAYMMAIIGPLPAFLNAWVMLVIVNPSSFAVLALTTTNYIFKPIFRDCALPFVAQKLFSVWLVVTVVVLNSCYVRYVTRVQIFLTAAKMAALALIIVSGAVHIAKGNYTNFTNAFEGSKTDPAALAVAVYSGIFTYGGWQYLFMIIEEIKNPHRTVPRSSILSLMVVTALYVFTNIAYFSVMTPAQMMQSEAVASTFAEGTLGKFAVVIPAFVACSTIGSLNGSILGGSRLFFATARDGLFPDILAMIHVHYLTPWPSIWLMCLLSVIYIVVGDAVALIEYLGFIGGIVFVIVLSCVLYLRWKRPDVERPMKIPIVIPVFSFVLVTSLVCLGLFSRPVQNGIGLLLLLSGIPIYLVLVSRKKKPAIFIEWSRKITSSIQKVMLVLPQQKED